MKKYSLILLLISAISLSSCSVVMAAKKEGVNAEQVNHFYKRSQLLACGGTVIERQSLPNGEFYEVVRMTKERGSAARALMHGLLDISTFGIWEVAGTPMEACLNKKEYYCLKVYYGCDETIKKVEIL